MLPSWELRCATEIWIAKMCFVGKLIMLLRCATKAFYSGLKQYFKQYMVELHA